jgi:serine acetyltransferase
MGGVTIGDNCIIGAGSIVTKNIPSNSVAAGMPARVICSIDEYYHKAVEKGKFYYSSKLSKAEKKQYLMTHVKPLS